MLFMQLETTACKKFQPSTFMHAEDVDNPMSNLLLKQGAITIMQQIFLHQDNHRDK